ncbi:NADH-quinone oxidoreductase subunit L [Limnoglobus roseus]|uniref:NADH-quinone oxidoreductase subunit L n=1 Tax=Limnoglobus roseus TaxID=2598579 RepID=A0A5C1AIR9_9BACT|nr:NADH-quinone oxidoreductase subunit L [Limnoglobus roseus]QEL17014.1 NADH-quinone oxidoreductase subunit L [Limnoglobus roseus]
MSSTALAVSVLALLLAATLLTPLLAKLRLRRYAHLPAVLAFGTSAVLAMLMLNDVYVNGPAGPTPGLSLHVSADFPWISFHETKLPTTWFSAGLLNVTFSLGIDPLSAIMLATVTFVATWIAIFSAGYMHGEEGYARYFTIMSLFVLCMCLLVLANNFFLLLAGWEGVGLCSYLLVGYYYAKPSAAAAARKAFLMTRLGDVGFVLGIFLLWSVGGHHTDLTQIFAHIQAHPVNDFTLGLACLLLFCGAVGKSAQLPLYVWLPDAMEGPTPVSALIHAATMVTAGVYLLARCSPLFVQVPSVQAYVAITGGATALLAAFIALTQTDLKRVLAYSTVSQLGYMFMALGTAGAVTPSIAVAAAIFHLFTHAFFKALLFLGSGSVMHAMGNVIDMRRFGGLRTVLPVTHATFLIGCAALAGLPLLSGFWSKDQILDALDHAGEHGLTHRELYLGVFGVAVLTAGMTAFYTFRAYFLTFWGETRIPEEAGHHAHESPRIMCVPLIVLAVGALFVGALVEPLTHHGFSKFLSATPAIQQANKTYEREHNVRSQSQPHFNWLIAGLGTAAAVGGLGLAFAMYRKGQLAQLPAAAKPLHAMSLNKGYVDEIYHGLVVKPAEIAATGSRQFDGLVDAVARLVSYAPRMLAALLRPLQNGLVQFYALGMVLGLTAVVLVIVFKVSR